MTDAMEKVRPELRSDAAAARNAHARARAAFDEGHKHMRELKTLLLRLRVQGVSTWTLAGLLGVNQTTIRKFTKGMRRRDA